MRKIGILGFVAISTVIGGCATPTGVQSSTARQPMSVSSAESSTKNDSKQSQSREARSARFVVLRMLDVKQSSRYVADNNARQDMSAKYCDPNYKLRASSQYLSQPVTVVYVARCDKNNRLVALAAAHSPSLNRDQKVVSLDDQQHPIDTYYGGTVGVYTFPVLRDGSIAPVGEFNTDNRAFGADMYYRPPKQGYSGYFALDVTDHVSKALRGLPSTFPSQPKWDDGTDLQPVQMAFIALMTLAETNSAGAALAGMLAGSFYEFRTGSSASGPAAALVGMLVESRYAKAIASIPRGAAPLSMQATLDRLRDRYEASEVASQLARDKSLQPATFDRASAFLDENRGKAIDIEASLAGFGRFAPLDPKDRCAKAVIATIAKLNRDHTTIVVRRYGTNYDYFKDRYQAVFHEKNLFQFNGVTENFDTFAQTVARTGKGTGGEKTKLDIVINATCTAAILRHQDMNSSYRHESAGGSVPVLKTSVARIDAEFLRSQNRGKVTRQSFTEIQYDLVRMMATRGSSGVVPDFEYVCDDETCRKAGKARK